jgi:hypothetical protein
MGMLVVNMNRPYISVVWQLSYEDGVSPEKADHYFELSQLIEDAREVVAKRP